MFEKLIDLFFKSEDVSEKEEFDVVQEQGEKEITLKDFEDFQKEESEVKTTAPQTVVREDVKVENVVENKTRSTFHIKADGVSEKDFNQKKKVRMVKREEYEIQPVISPYFGVKGEVKATPKVEKKPTVSYKKETKKSEYSEVISPIYGVKEKKKTILEEVNTMPVFFEKKKEVVPSYDAIEDEENIALDDLLTSKAGNDDDMIQFSLFGDDKRIQEDVFTNEDIDGDDSLPF